MSSFKHHIKSLTINLIVVFFAGFSSNAPFTPLIPWARREGGGQWARSGVKGQRSESRKLEKRKRNVVGERNRYKSPRIQVNRTKSSLIVVNPATGFAMAGPGNARRSNQAAPCLWLLFLRRLRLGGNQGRRTVFGGRGRFPIPSEAFNRWGFLRSRGPVVPWSVVRSPPGRNVATLLPPCCQFCCHLSA
jgi:hypothetical protein